MAGLGKARLGHGAAAIGGAPGAARRETAAERQARRIGRDPRLWEREMLVKMEDPVAGEMYLPGATIKMSKTPGRIGPVPTPGQHTDEVLSRLLGYGRTTLDELRRTKVIA